MLKVVILGSGNIASHLLPAIHQSGVATVIQQYSRSLKKHPINKLGIPVTNDLNALKPADLYVVCVSDDAIQEVTEQITPNTGLVVHTSGSAPLSAIASKHKKGVFYPLQTFSKSFPVNIKSVPICLEAETEDELNKLDTLAKAISEHVHYINSEQRQALHLAAVFVNNFVNHLYHIAFEICVDNKVPFTILEPLIEETAKKALQLGPYQAQTGPAKRFDNKTIQKHVEALKFISQKEIYNLLTHSIQETYGRKKL